MEMAPSSSERILVIEDDRAVQKALKRLFEAEGFTVDLAGNGAVGGGSDEEGALEAVVWSVWKCFARQPPPSSCLTSVFRERLGRTSVARSARLPPRCQSSF